MSTKLALLSIGLAVQSVSAFHVDFYLSPQCAGEFLGRRTGGTERRCGNGLVGQAEGALITKSSPADHDTVVAFYSSDDCNPENIIGEADSGCIAVDSFASRYKSWNIIGGGNRPPPRIKRSQEAKVQQRAPVPADDSTSTPAGVFNARLREHGEISDYFGKDMKWQQVADGMWRGINPDEWDDEKHAKNTTVIDDAMAEAAVAQLQKRSLSTDLIALDEAELEKRYFLRNACSVVKSCGLATYHAGRYGGYAVQYVADKFLQRALIICHSDNLWECLNQPVVQAITLGNAAGALSGVVSALTAKAIAPKSCSSNHNDYDTITGALRDVAANAPPNRAVQITIEDADGNKGTLSMEAVPKDLRGDGNLCGAPSTEPTNGSRRLKRSAKFIEVADAA